MGQSLGPAWTVCGHCGLPLKSGRAICSGCGAIAPLERAGARARALFGTWYKQGPTMLRADLILWGLALSPLLIVPPLVAIAMAWRRHGQRIGSADASWVTIAALVNIVVSTVILTKLRADGLHLLDWLTWPHWIAPAAPHEHPTLTPI